MKGGRSAQTNTHNAACRLAAQQGSTLAMRLSRKQPRAYSLRLALLLLLCAEPACEALPLAKLSLPDDCWLP